MSGLVVWPPLAAIAMTLLLVWGRNFFWSHAIIIGLAAAALVYSILRTAERLKNHYRR